MEIIPSETKQKRKQKERTTKTMRTKISAILNENIEPNANCVSYDKSTSLADIMKPICKTVVKGIAISFTTVAIATALTSTNVSAKTYPSCGLVTSVKKTSEMSDDNYPLYKVVTTMQNGNRFAFLTEDTDWFKYDLAAIEFDDNGTDCVYDDIIIGSPRYVGWISKREAKSWIKRAKKVNKKSKRK